MGKHFFVIFLHVLCLLLYFFAEPISKKTSGFHVRLIVHKIGFVKYVLYCLIKYGAWLYLGVDVLYL